ncbi:hypothetical protein QFC24_005785 [Naganishia onofrii]|uniref:Uncharacterized protein n=1 Tax=Naganishia onofrii TaxID=1851511 RepID=A0ACC2X7C9_9TREE|nr:hypothetical protein QFC24_005785 [Naganishia onofrii]
MGPAGAGKSTLLDLMSGRKDYDAGGDIVFHGHSLAKKEFRLLSSFVEQEDALIGTLTARETLTYALRLAMPYEKAGFLKERVEQVLDMLGLQCCSDMQIGTPLKRGLSGGQKRRVSIGCCLVTYPSVSKFFLNDQTPSLMAGISK